ncbi:MAG: MBOAT family protein [Lachnospiraceae bacterium]|nr:MBOAT family protein [Lachnospiraceae bacterium]
MLFNSVDFLVFFPIVVLLYYCIPNRFRYIWLLVCSYYFYMCWNVEYALLLLGSTIITYFSGMLIEKFAKSAKENGKAHKKGAAKAVVVVSFVLNLGILFFFKYFDFFTENLEKALSIVNIQVQMPQLSLLLPVGISFYIFQALGYTMDVYRGDIKAEKNFLKYAVFVSFFPQLVAGPIERSKNLLKQFSEEHKFDLKRVQDSLLLMAWGYFCKMVIADRIAIFVDAVYSDYVTYGGWYIAVATVLFAFQIYCDFAGYSTIAMGAAGVMGFRLMENFEGPYCAVSVPDFWKRWHISLTSWFRDYLYIPLGGNRKGKFRKYLNKIIVFLVSGFWHGAQWSYVIWGGLNGLFIVLSEIFAPSRRWLKEKLGWKENAASNKVLQAITTFLLVDFTWIFFRAPGTKDALQMIQSMLTVKNFGIFFDSSLYRLGLDRRNFYVMILSIILLLVVDICHNKGIRIRKWLESQNLWFRWLVYILLIESVLIFGIWGVGYDKAAFIYFQF